MSKPKLEDITYRVIRPANTAVGCGSRATRLVSEGRILDAIGPAGYMVGGIWSCGKGIIKNFFPKRRTGRRSRKK